MSDGSVLGGAGYEVPRIRQRKGRAPAGSGYVRPRADAGVKNNRGGGHPGRAATPGYDPPPKNCPCRASFPGSVTVEETRRRRVICAGWFLNKSMES